MKTRGPAIAWGSTQTNYEMSIIPLADRSVRFMFVHSTGWTHARFTVNTDVSSSPECDVLSIQLAVDTSKRTPYESAQSIAEQLNEVRALMLIEKMRHALYDYPNIPENIHIPLIGNMGKLALAHALDTINLTSPRIFGKFYPVATSYATKTVQSQKGADVHRKIRDLLMTRA